MTAPKFKVPAQTPRAQGCCYNFGPFSLRPDGTLFRDQNPVALPPKELAVLSLFLASDGNIVPSEQLRRDAWGDIHVTSDSLSRCISSLRAILEPCDCLQTVYKRGYRFTLPVLRVSQEPQPVLERRAARAMGPPRLVILPLVTGEGVPEFLGAGISEETMLRLGRERHPAVEVIARDSVFHLSSRGASACEIGSALGAELAVTGTITALPLHYRLRIEMIRISDAVQLWIEDFLVSRSLLSYADARIAKRITARIRNSFASAISPVPDLVHAQGGGRPEAEAGASASAQGPAAATHREAHRSEAYRIYLQACAQWNTYERHHMQDAMRGFQRSLDLDATMHGARLQLAHGFLSQSSLGYMRADIAAEMARKQVEIAHSLASDGPSLYPALGWIHFHHDRDLSAAEEAFSRPIRGSCSSMSAVYKVRFALGQGRFREALAELRKEIDANPHSALLHGRLAWALHLAGESNNAAEQAISTHKQFPDHPGALLFCSIVLAATCKPGDCGSDLARRAEAVATRLTQRAPFLDAGYATLAYTHARQGRILEARSLLDRQLWLSRERFVMRSFHAPALVELGECDAAIEALAIAEQQHCPWIFELLADPRLAPLHREPEFQRLCGISRQAVASNVSVA